MAYDFTIQEDALPVNYRVRIAHFSMDLGQNQFAICVHRINKDTYTHALLTVVMTPDQLTAFCDATAPVGTQYDVTKQALWTFLLANEKHHIELGRPPAQGDAFQDVTWTEVNQA